jgi:hypothetical protein
MAPYQVPCDLTEGDRGIKGRAEKNDLRKRNSAHRITWLSFVVCNQARTGGGLHPARGGTVP